MFSVFRKRAPAEKPGAKPQPASGGSKSSHFAPNMNHPVIQAGIDVTGTSWNAPGRMLPFFWRYRKPKSVGEYGCGPGNWLYFARRLGATTVHGFDIPELDISDRTMSAEEFTAVDLSKEFLPHRRFDLAISTEVGEHLPIEAAPVFVRNLTWASDWVLFGAAAPYQGGLGHINENWLEFWAGLFADNGYVCYDILRLEFWHDAAIPHYYRQNTCLYVRRGSDQSLRDAGFTPTPCPPTLIHPEQYLAGAAVIPLHLNVATKSMKMFYRLSKAPKP
jgi:SAM-dependent methyltransferase